MPTLRAYGASLATPATPSLKVFGASLTGTLPNTAALRVFKAQLTGSSAVTIDPIAPQTVEPMRVVPLTVTTQGTPDSFSIRQISGPAVTPLGAGPSWTFMSPSAMPPGTTVIFGVTAVTGGIAGAEVQARFDVLPQTEWSRAPGGQWVGASTVAV